MGRRMRYRFVVQARTEAKSASGSVTTTWTDVYRTSGELTYRGGSEPRRSDRSLPQGEAIVKLFRDRSRDLTTSDRLKRTDNNELFDIVYVEPETEYGRYLYVHVNSVRD